MKILNWKKKFKVSVKTDEFNFKTDDKTKKQFKHLKIDKNSNLHCQMANRLGVLFLRPTFDNHKYSSLTNNTSVQTHKHSKFNLSSASKSFTESAINEMPSITSFSKIPTTTTQMSSKVDASPTSKRENKPKLPVRARLRDEIDLKAHFEIQIPNYTTRKGFDLMRIVEDQVCVL